MRKNGQKVTIYFLYDGSTHTVKIGKSQNPNERIRSFNLSIPGLLIGTVEESLVCGRCGNFDEDEGCIDRYDECRGFEISEKGVHERFRRLRLRKKNEWFKCSKSILEFLRNYGEVLISGEEFDRILHYRDKKWIEKRKITLERKRELEMVKAINSWWDEVRNLKLLIQEVGVQINCDR